MQNDVSISYNAKLIEVEDNIKQLESLGMNTINYREIIENIKTETKTEIKNCYTKYNQIDSNVF